VTWNPEWLPTKAYYPYPWTDEAYAELRDSMNTIPEGGKRGDALERIKTLDCANPDKTLASCTAKSPSEVLAWQKRLISASVNDRGFAKALAKELRGLVCESDANALYILRGISGKSNRLADTGREASALVEFIMSKDCPVSAALTDDDKAKLLKIKQDAEKKFPPAPASKKEK
jgi:hypothetical protein